MQIENLARAGAFDTLEPNRARLFAAAEAILRRAQATAEEKESGQIALFGGTVRQFQGTAASARHAGLGADGPAGLRGRGDRLPSHRASARRLRQGAAPAGHDACAQVEAVAQAGVTRVRLAGTVVAQKERVTRTGNRMAWVRITDASGSCEVTLFAEVLRARARSAGQRRECAGHCRSAGRMARRCGSPRRMLSSLDQAAASAGAAMRIWLRETAAVPHIRDLLGREGSGKGRVILVPRLGTTQSVEIALPGGFNVTPRLAQALKTLPGVDQVEEL